MHAHTPLPPALQHTKPILLSYYFYSNPTPTTPSHLPPPRPALRPPPPASRLPPLQVVIVPIPNSKMDDEAKDALMAKASELEVALKAAGVRVSVDRRLNYTPGWKYNYWELRVRRGGAGRRRW